MVETGASTGDKELMAEAEADLVGLAMPRDVPKSKPGKPVEFLVDPPSDGVGVLEESGDSVLLS